MGEEIFAGLGSLYYIPGGIGKGGEIVGEPQEINISESKLEMGGIDLGACEGDKSCVNVWNRGPLTIEISAENFPSAEELLNGSGCFDIVAKGRNGEKVHLWNQKIDVSVIITKRTPRKMKKELKKRFGDKWKHYHPNADFNVEIKSEKNNE